jgi:hypothetical protein
MAGEGMGAQWECVGRSYFLRYCEGGTTVKILSLSVNLI